MDPLTQLRVLALAAWIGLCALTLGAALVTTGLLNLRDRRHSKLLGVVLPQLPLSGAGGRIPVQIRSGVFSRRSEVTIDMRAHSRQEICDTLARLSRHLPPHVRLAVDGLGDPQLPVTLKLKAGNLLHRPARPLAAGS